MMNDEPGSATGGRHPSLWQPEEVKPLVGVKDDSDKLRYDLIDLDAEAELAAVLTYGSYKYDANNWREVDDAKNRYFGAARRHLSKYMRGEVLDPENRLLHLSEAETCVHFLAALELATGQYPLAERLPFAIAQAKRIKANRLGR